MKMEAAKTTGKVPAHPGASREETEKWQQMWLVWPQPWAPRGWARLFSDVRGLQRG